MSTASGSSGPEAKEDIIPLLSDDAKGFLDGKIDALRYVQVTRRTTTDEARREFYGPSAYPRLRRLSSSIFFFAAVAYAGLGAALASSNVQGSFIAFATAGISALVGLRFRYRNTNRACDRSSFD
jgi:hypothetical protein